MLIAVSVAIALLTVIVGALALTSGGPWDQVAEPEGSLLPQGSIGVGTAKQDAPSYSYPNVLFVRRRGATQLEGATWYPSLGYGMVQIRGACRKPEWFASRNSVSCMPKSMTAQKWWPARIAWPT